MRSPKRIYESLEAQVSERDSIPVRHLTRILPVYYSANVFWQWYWRLISLASSCKILGG